MSGASRERSGAGAFGLGVEHARPYRLRLARYPAAAEVIEAHVGDRAALALDAGVGRGRVARVATAPGLRWVGLDLSAERLATAAGSGRYRLVRGDLGALPFAPGRFDVVCCIQVLEHFEASEARALASSLARLLAPGGLLLLSVPIFPPGSIDLLHAANRVRARLGLGPFASGGDHQSHFDLRRALALVPEGFRVSDVRGVRLFSLAGKALEHRHWWYQAQGWAGRRFPAWTIEVNIAARKTGPAPSRPAPRAARRRAGSAAP